jgi:cyclopropane-fatty-acyl-phospholipid synthase
VSAVALCAVAAMLVAWTIQQRTRNAGIVDVFWAFGMMFAGAYYAYAGTAPVWARAALAVLVVGWFARLGLHILRRVLSESVEDGRYLAMREWLGPRAAAGMFVFFQLQAAFVVLFSLPFLAVANSPEPNPWWVAAGLVVALTALLGEATADGQLRRFKANPANKGRTLRQGLWRYSRHPNYFFEWVHWFAYPLMGVGGPYAHLLWLAPAFMLLFLLVFTGIPFTERQALRSRGDDYRRYQEQTSMFFPWPPSTSK